VSGEAGCRGKETDYFLIDLVVAVCSRYLLYVKYWCGGVGGGGSTDGQEKSAVGAQCTSVHHYNNTRIITPNGDGN
jgi:hypothetical protein